jgi:hypothetical protein
MKRVCLCLRVLEQNFCAICTECGFPGHYSSAPPPLNGIETWCDICYQQLAEQQKILFLFNFKIKHDSKILL